MGDRTTVTLTVLTCHYEQVKDIFKGVREPNAYNTDEVELMNSVSVTWLQFEEVNYGNLPHLDKLTSLGIAFSIEWEEGYEYSEGEQKVYFTEEGEEVYKNYDASNLKINYQELRNILSLTSNPLADLEARVAVMTDLLRPINWENQEEYGKRYRARQLIGA